MRSGSKIFLNIFKALLRKVRKEVATNSRTTCDLILEKFSTLLMWKWWCSSLFPFTSHPCFCCLCRIRVLLQNL